MKADNLLILRILNSDLGKVIILNKKLLLKSFAFSTIIICFIPSVFALAMTNDNDMVLLPNEEFDALSVFSNN